MPTYSDPKTPVLSSADMDINHNLNQRVVIKPEKFSWVSSPMAGIEQMIFEQMDQAMGRTTGLFRYTTHGRLAPPIPEGGEEIFVLDGTLTDEHGEYPTGTYIRNPIGTSTQPRLGAHGTTLFIKSHPFAPGDTHRTVIKTNTAPWHPGLVEGLHVMPLHESEHVALVRWAPYTQFQPHSHWGGEEILVLDGVFHDEHDHYPKGTWIRSPHLSRHTPFTKQEGALIYVKTGHLSKI